MAIGADLTKAPNGEAIHSKIWPNLKKNAMEKKQKQSKTGAKGGKLLEMDMVILDIIGPDSAMLKPLSLPSFPVVISGMKQTTQLCQALKPRRY